MADVNRRKKGLVLLIWSCGKKRELGRALSETLLTSSEAKR